MAKHTAGRWLLLIHQIPPRPNYLRVKIWRRLQRLGAVAIKSSVYALPVGDSAREDFHWVACEIAESGGEATVCEAQLVEGLTDSAVESLFQSARDADYAQLAEEARGLKARALDSLARGTDARELLGSVGRLRKRLAEVGEIDFFTAPGREAAEGLVSELERLLAEAGPSGRPAEDAPREPVRGGTWVTRKGIHVDRMASAWLIRRFIDPEARLRFVDPGEYRHHGGELRFDMFEAEFTHEGDLCTFEVLIQRFGLTQPALRPLAELVHDIDLKDGKFGRAETTGFERLVAGIALAHREDEERLARASAVLDDLYVAFERKEGPLASAKATKGRGPGRKTSPTRRRDK